MQKIKINLHKDNPHRGSYDFEKLIKENKDIEEFVILNPLGEKTIDFSNAKAVKLLNKALLKSYYDIEFWDLPEGYLVPPIPGRVDYLCYVKELITNTKKVKVLDIGTGAGCIYPLLGSQLFSWNFVASDVDPVSIRTSELIAKSNKKIRGQISLRLQKNKDKIFDGIIKENEIYDLTICNPPFHSSLEEAMEANMRKIKNLNKKIIPSENNLNFGGQKAELWCEGGEISFLKKMVKESVVFKNQVKWFTTLVSKSENVKPLEMLLNLEGAREIKVIQMSQGQKISRIIAWSYEAIS